VGGKLLDGGAIKKIYKTKDIADCLIDDAYVIWYSDWQPSAWLKTLHATQPQNPLLRLFPVMSPQLMRNLLSGRQALPPPVPVEWTDTT